jgi:DNA-binding transcriptional ArsR family regulator
VLREHTLVKVEREGRRRVYALYDEHVVVLLEEALRHVEQRTKSKRKLSARIRRAAP